MFLFRNRHSVGINRNQSMDGKLKIFLSHIHEEKNFAISVKKELEKLYLGAIQIFVSSDEDGVLGGDKWLSVIEKKLSESDVILVLASPESIKRPWINFEAGGGWFLQKRVIPLCIFGLSPLALPEPLHSLQGYNLQEKEGVRRILTDISRAAGLLVPDVDIDALHHRIVALMPDTVSLTQYTVQVEESTAVAKEMRNDKNIDQIPFLRENSTIHFSNRMADAFPGIRELTWFTEPREAIDRLSILLKTPLRFRVREGKALPMWWWRGGSDNHIESFKVLGKTTCLMNTHELEISKLAAYRSASYYREFVYVETNPSQPIGLYDYPNGYVEERKQEWGYYKEEYALLNDKPISRTEYDDNSAVINGKVVDAYGAELRIRYLSKYNFIIAAQMSPINNSEFDMLFETILNELLEGVQEFESLLDAVLKLPRRKNEYY